jgi:phytoene dehydrogenase-like protein
VKGYDLLVIGSGAAAQAASVRVRAAGWQVAVIDHRPFGGTCALRGCDPKKMLVSGAEAIIKPLGMQKLPGTLTWKLGVDRPGGYHQFLYVDSHNGDVVKSTIINAQGAPVLDVAPHDYRSIEGIRVPFATDYRSPDGTLLASDRVERVVVKRTRS